MREYPEKMLFTEDMKKVCECMNMVRTPDEYGMIPYDSFLYGVEFEEGSNEESTNEYSKEEIELIVKFLQGMH